MNAEEFLEHYDIRNDTIYSRNEEAHLLSHLLEAFANYKTEQLQKEVERLKGELKSTLEDVKIAYDANNGSQESKYENWSSFLKTLKEQPTKEPIENKYTALAKANYKSKDGTIKKGIEIDGKFYALKNDVYRDKEPTEVKCEDGVPFPKKVFNKIIQREDE